MMTVEPQTYQRQELTTEEKERLSKYISKFVFHKSRREIIFAMAALCAENAKLTKEVNDHRAARGFELLPVCDGRESC